MLIFEQAFNLIPDAGIKHFRSILKVHAADSISNTVVVAGKIKVSI